MIGTRKLLRRGSRAPTPAQRLQSALWQIDGLATGLENFDASKIEPALIEKFVADMKEHIGTIETALKRMSA